MAIDRQSPLGRLLYGQGDADEGTVQLDKGTVAYSYEDDKFRCYDLAGKRVFFDDWGKLVEGWLVRNGWVD